MVQVQQLLDSLDDRGVCERALRRSLQEEMAPLLANLASEKPQDDLHEWRSEGPFMGVRVRQMFEGVGASEATGGSRARRKSHRSRCASLPTPAPFRYVPQCLATYLPRDQILRCGI